MTRVARIERYLREYSEAKKQEDSGDAVIVHCDESYLGTNHGVTHGRTVKEPGTKYGRFGQSKVELPSAGGGVARSKAPRGGDVKSKGGRRIIFLAAMTRHGLLAELEADASEFAYSRGAREDTWQTGCNPDAGIQRRTTTWAFQAKSKCPDYHDNMDSVMFMRVRSACCCPTHRALPMPPTQHPNL